MTTKTLILDKRTSKNIYEQAISLAKFYCPEWAQKDWKKDHFDPDDPGLVIFMLFSNMEEFLIKQMNNVPEKYRLAFFDFIGIDLLPAQPSRVPLTFYLAEGSDKAFVPADTSVASSIDPEIVFETERSLGVVPVKFDAISFNPWEDRFTDHSNAISKGEVFSIFGKDKDEKLIEHILYIGDDVLFDLRKPLKNLKIRFQGGNLSSEYFQQWFDCSGNRLEFEISPDPEKKYIEFEFKNIQKLEPSVVEGISSSWLKIKPDDKTKVLSKKGLPEISGVTVDLNVNGIFPDHAFLNDAPLDMKKGFYPFGNMPKVGDAFYISSEEIFSKKDSAVTMNIELVEDLNDATAKIAWEYWDGTVWKMLDIAEDGTKKFTKSGVCQIKFNCPSIDPADINGQKNRWIRARISSGGYGKEAKLDKNSLDYIISLLPGSLDQHKNTIKTELEKKGIYFGFNYYPPSYMPPFIKSINIDYSFNEKKLQRMISGNNFKYKSFNEFNKFNRFVPYEPCDLEMPALYIGFEKIISDILITLFFSIKEPLYGEKKEMLFQNPDADNHNSASLVWKYFDGNSWKEMTIKRDETDSFRRTGIVCFVFPKDMKTTFESGKDLYWIKIEPMDGKRIVCPKLRGVFPNTVWAANSATIKDEIIGSGNGEPGQSFFLSKKPVLENQVIGVEEGDSFVEWHEVKDFTFSDKQSRHYILDRMNGEIIFGNGLRGMPPPKGRNNIKAKLYRSGGGKKGNLKEGTITSLKKSIPNIERVMNHVPSSGGIDQETVGRTIYRAPHVIKNGNRGVTEEDLEWLACEASEDVARAKCIPVKKNKITVIILPRASGDAPQPDTRTLEHVEKYIKDRVFFMIQDRIEIAGPTYKKLDVKVNVKPVSLSEIMSVLERIEKELRKFFNPVKGGLNGEGWNFGQDISFSDIAGVIENTEGVDYVVNLDVIVDGIAFDKISGKDLIRIESNALTCPGNIDIEIS